MDLNGDKIPDIISGCYSSGNPMAGHFYVFWGAEGNTFQRAQVLKGVDGKTLEVNKKEGTRSRICTRPTAVDWDNDGDLDLVVGNMKGTFVLFTGEGEGKFNSEGSLIKINDKPLAVEGYRSDPTFVDWDGDGDLDLLSGAGNGGAYWAENTAGAGKAISLKAFKTIVEGSRAPRDVWHDKAPQPGYSSRVFASDVNGDGKMDLLLGDYMTVKTPLAGLTIKEAEVKEGEWQKKAAALDKRIEAEEDDDVIDKLADEYEELDMELEKIVQSRATGRIWLYLSK